MPDLDERPRRNIGTLAALDEGQRRSVHVPPDIEELVRPKHHPDDQEQAHSAREQNRRNRLYTSFFAADLNTLNGVLGPLFPDGCHLNEEADIASVYIENNGATAKVGICFGESGSFALSVFAPIKNGGYKVYALPDGIRSVSFWPNVANDAGLVSVIITTRRWSPKTGTL